MECIVCFEETKDKTNCNHSLCKECKGKLITMKCPYCRQELENSLEIIIAFSHFVYLFDSFYKNNYYYNKLKEGIDLNSIITTDLLFFIKEIDDFDSKGIRIKIYKQSYQYHCAIGCIIFSTPGLDNRKREYRYITINNKGLILENYFDE